MELYIVRHAIAFEHDFEKWPGDRDRPLTPEGARKFRRVARRLGRLEPRAEAVLSSPLARAWQTAEILHKEAGWPAPEAFPALEPGVPPEELMRRLKARASAAPLALVGHEPVLSNLLSHLLAGPRGHAGAEMKKGGAALIRMGADLRPGTGTLLALLPPRVVLSLVP